MATPNCLIISFLFFCQRFRVEFLPSDLAAYSELILIGARKLWYRAWTIRIQDYDTDEVTLDTADQQLQVFLSIKFHRLFFGTSSQMIHAGFAPLLLDVERIGTYSWGLAVLLYLISRLEAFAAGQTRALSGCPPHF